MRPSQIFLIICLMAFPCFCGAIHPVPGPDGKGFSLPKYEQFKLKNGLTVYLMEQHEVPLIYSHLVFRAGASRDGSYSGLASLTADALLHGTQKYSKAAIEEEVDFLGASLRTEAGLEAAHITASFGTKDLDRVFDILQQVVMFPKFDPVEFEKEKSRRLISLQQAKESPRSVMDDYFGKLMFGDHPYGNPVSGTRPAVEKITPERIREFYKTFYIASNAAIAIVGDFDSKDMKKRLQASFGKWKTARPFEEKRQPPKLEFQESRVLLVNKSDSRETRFYIAGPGVARDNPDFVAIEVVNTVLGGRFTSWLNDELRVNSGLTYGARSRFTPYRMAGTFHISTFTKTSTTVEAIDLALKTYDRLHKQGIDEKTLESAKNYIKGGLPPRFETSGNLAGFLADMYIYGIGPEYINSFQEKVDALTVDKAREIVAKYFPKENLQFLLIGKAEEIRDDVGKYGTLSEKEITEDGF